MMKTLIKLTAAAALSAACLAVPAQAQNFSRPIRIVVPYAPGGSSDILARLLAPKLQVALGQPVVVENKPGGAGNIGADAVAKASKDGHTLLLCDVGTLAMAPSLFPDLTFNVEKDLAPVTMIMFAPYVMGLSTQVPVKNVKELQAYSKANPGKLAVAHSGVGSLNHITAVQVMKGLGVEWKMVPYRGGAAATRAVVSNEGQLIFNGTTATLPFVKNNQMVGLALTGPARIKSAPDIATFDELKLAAGDAGTWQGLLATAGSPPELVAKLDAEVRKALTSPDIAGKIDELGGTVKAEGPQSFKTWLSATAKSLGDVVRENGIKGE